MAGPCMCGDIMCPSCGPAQGYDPKYEALYDKVFDRLPDFLAGVASLTSDQIDDLTETITTRISIMLAAQELDAERKFFAQLEEEEKLSDGSEGE